MSCVIGNSSLSRSSGKTRSAVETQESGGVHTWGMVGVIGLVRGGRHSEGRRGWLRMGTREQSQFRSWAGDGNSHRKEDFEDKPNPPVSALSEECHGKGAGLKRGLWLG